MPIPVQKANDLIDRLRKLEGRPEEEFALTAIERDAQRLLKSDPAAGWHVLGLLAAHRYDEEGVRSAFSNAMKLSPGDFAAQENFAKALHKLGFYREALERALALIAKDGSNAATLRFAVGCAVRGGAYKTASELNERLRKLNMPVDAPVIDKVAELLDRHRVSEDETRARADVVVSVLAERGMRVSGVHCELFGQAAGIRYFVRGSADQVAEANEAIADTLCARFSDPLDRTVVFGCRPV